MKDGGFELMPQRCRLVLLSWWSVNTRPLATNLVVRFKACDFHSCFPNKTGVQLFFFQPNRQTDRICALRCSFRWRRQFSSHLQFALQGGEKRFVTSIIREQVAQVSSSSRVQQEDNSSVCWISSRQEKIRQRRGRETMAVRWISWRLFTILLEIVSSCFGAQDDHLLENSCLSESQLPAASCKRNYRFKDSWLGWCPYLKQSPKIVFFRRLRLRPASVCESVHCLLDFHLLHNVQVTTWRPQDL